MVLDASFNKSKEMNLNFNQKIIISLGMLMILISFLMPPCYKEINGIKTWEGYNRLVLLTHGGFTLVHIPTFYAQLIVIILITIGFVIIST